MLEQLKNKAKTPDFFTEEQQHYAESRIETLTQGADITLQRKLEQDRMQGDMLREDAVAYQNEYRETQTLAQYEKHCRRKTAEIDANPKYSSFKKKKEKKKLVKNRESIMGQIAGQLDIPEMISEARMKEAEENLEFFTAQETSVEIESEKAKALFSPEEREKFKTDRHINLLISHHDLQTDHEKNQKIMKGYLSDKTEERREFVQDVYKTVNAMPTDTFEFNGPVAFREKYAAMYEACQKVLTYRSVLTDGFSEEQAALKEAQPELLRTFEDRMEYFTKCAKLFGLYRSYLSTGEYGATDEMRKAVQQHDGDLSRLAYKQDFLAESEKTGIRFGQTGYEERLNKKTEQKDKAEEARLRYEKAMEALRNAPDEPEGEFASPQLSLLKEEAAQAQKQYQELGGSYITKFGYDQVLPELDNVELTEKQVQYVEAYKQFTETEKQYRARVDELRRIMDNPQSRLKDLYGPEKLHPFFRDALMAEYGDVYSKFGLEAKAHLPYYFTRFRDSEQKLRALTRPEDRGQEHCPEELPAEFVMTQKEQELFKLTLNNFRIEGESGDLGEPLFRSFGSFGNFSDLEGTVTKEELRQMLRNLGAGSNGADANNPEESQAIREKNLAGVATYKKILHKHYGDMFAKYGDVDQMSFEERRVRRQEMESAFSNMQVDNHWVDRFGDLFQAPEDAHLVKVIHYYNMTSAFMIISEANIDGMGLEAAMEMDKQTQAHFKATPEYKESKKALFK
ncbi:hypothetical protein SDC9_57862 [bioreactor metagenome]|uniref:Uncharacterized protein n=1 Tax=bioreactor metagenome TaxID=1076179 RepID=A0A644X5T3_9ZZZZ